MSNRELPMMPWFPKEFAAATSTWTFDERGAYRALLDIQWEERLLPDEPERLARAIGMDLERFRKLWPKVRRKFVKVEDGILNERLEEHRYKSMDLKDKRSNAGKAGGIASGKSRKQKGKQTRSKTSSKSEAQLEANGQAKPKPPSPSPSPSVREEHPQPPQGGRAGLAAHGGGRKSREERDASLSGWRDIAPVIDDIASTGSLPPDQRRTWADVGKYCTDPIAVRAAEQVGFRAIADRNKFTTSELQTRFRDAYERIAAEAAH